jgi:tripartite ATP-independent transporter DctM subunit
MEAEFATPTVLAVFFLLIFSGAPVFLALGLSSLTGMFLTRGFQGVYQLPASMISQLDSFLLVSLPLYILMGEAISKSGVGGEIFSFLERFLRRISGGLGIASIFACAVFGAMCGVSVAGVAAIGIVAVPEMIKRGYDRSLAAGCVTAAGALAVLIPPSISFIIYGALSGVSIGALFIGGIVPGVVLAIMMALYVFIRVVINPRLAPTLPPATHRQEWLKPLVRLWPVIVLLAAVLGSIYTGFTTATEAGGIGAAGALLVAFVRGRATWKDLKEIFFRTSDISAMVFIIMAAAFAFSQYLNLVRIPDNLSAWVVSLKMDPLNVILAIMVFFIILGMFVDGVSLIVITTPICLPTVKALGFDPLWYGILLVLNLEMAVITPPVGLNLYAMKSVIPELGLEDILKGALPFALVELVALLLFMYWPSLSLWLPKTM